MNSKEALKLTILEYEKDLEFDENNQWVKNVLNGLKECQQDLDQLEEHRKIEEELGIDLITLFKALKQKYVFHKENVKIELLGLHIKSNELYLYGFVEDTTQAGYLSLKEHKKTWGLTREELKEVI